MQVNKNNKKTESIKINQIRRTSLADNIVKELISYIVDQNLGYKDKLPSEKTLCEYLKVSRFPLREALSQLQALGIISVEHGKGIFVSDFSVKDLLTKLSPILRTQSNISVLDIMDARFAIECAVVKLAAQRRDEKAIKELEDALTQMEKELHNRIKFIDCDIRFHEILANTSVNPIFEDLVAILHNLMYIIQKSFPDSSEARKKSLKYHKGIFEAIKEKNPDQAEQLMRCHLENIIGRLTEKKV